MTIETLPLEVLCQIFALLDYQSLLQAAATCLGTASMKSAFFAAASITLSNSHVVVSNYLDVGFSRCSISDDYVRNIGNLISRECRSGSSISATYSVSSFDQIVCPPKILTFYLLYPGTDRLSKQSFIELVREFVNLKPHLLSNISKINVYVEYIEDLVQLNNFRGCCPHCQRTLGKLDLSVFRCLQELEKCAFLNPVLKSKLHIFSVNTYAADSRFNGMVDLGFLFDKSIVQMTQLTHLSLPYHSMDKMSSDLYLPKNLTSLSLAYSSVLASSLVVSKSFLPFLKYLNLSSCNLESVLSKTVVELPPSITCLNLADNNIVSLHNLKLPFFLRTLDLTNNKINSLQDTNGKPYEFPLGMINLNLSFNCLEGIPQQCKLPATLRRLSLGANYMNEWNLKVRFPDSLVHLDLSLNRLRTGSQLTVPALLRELDLSNNSVEYIGTGTLPSNCLGSLQMVNLSGNPVRLFDIFTGQSASSLCSLQAIFMSDMRVGELLENQILGGQAIVVPPSVKFLHMHNTGVNRTRFKDVKLLVLNVS